jgi:hypothetical protein
VRRLALLTAASAWIGFTMLLAQTIGVRPNPGTVRWDALVQYAGLLVVCVVLTFPVRRAQ